MCVCVNVRVCACVSARARVCVCVCVCKLAGEQIVRSLRRMCFLTFKVGLICSKTPFVVSVRLDKSDLNVCF
jgi:hypothetical protein